MGKRLTYGIPTHYHIVLVEHLGGLSAGDSFAGHLSLSSSVTMRLTHSYAMGVSLFTFKLRVTTVRLTQLR